MKEIGNRRVKRREYPKKIRMHDFVMVGMDGKKMTSEHRICLLVSFSGESHLHGVLEWETSEWGCAQVLRIAGQSGREEGNGFAISLPVSQCLFICSPAFSSV